ncbi:hypothetical protein F4693_002007 [Sphingomonas endophytica]|uniref:Uncharacterized protein n=1 Tax=Sphingomonas endophytica TaxID=869719 RepID=A0A7X0JCE3_9SPHN|nr:hypothetical protein [Sphingomonas endophytica]MBB6505026.1 hypothetical protein [Sphingomonas endophytica]
MGILCVLGLHRWAGKPTARAGTTVYRCATCGARLVLHDHRTRWRKRGWVAGALLLSGAIWFVSYNLVFHGRTRVLHTASAAARKAKVAASRGRAAIHRAQGDSGAYVDGDDDAPR